ncbi:MAG: signal peptidase I [Anaerolineales bacterium]|nr:signal peptidase I [Anaerolineales bacterium]
MENGNKEKDFGDISVEIPEKKDKTQGFLHFLIDLFEPLVLAAILYLGINAISARIRVDGTSMTPTLQSGEFVIVNKLAYKFGSTKLGDVVVFKFPRNPSQEYIKRVIGLPGDEIKIVRGSVLVNGQLLEEPYLSSPTAYQGNWVVPENQLFVLGDNRNNSSDSHNWGTVPMENVIGKAVFVYWPPAEWGKINTHPKTVSATNPYP